MNTLLLEVLGGYLVLCVALGGLAARWWGR